MKPIHCKVLELRKSGLSLKQISGALGLAKSTVSWVLDKFFDPEENDRLRKSLEASFKERTKEEAELRARDRNNAREIKKAEKDLKHREDCVFLKQNFHPELDIEYSAQAPPPFEDYLVYKPVKNSEGRRTVSLVPVDNSKKLFRTSISYAKFLYCVSIGRALSDTEEVDHRDGDKTNDNLSNLRILSPDDNKREYRTLSGLTKAVVVINCLGCSKKFVIDKRKTHLSKSGKFTSCSKECRIVVLSLLMKGLLSEEALSNSVVEVKQVPRS